MTVLLAPDKFKGSLTAAQAVQHLTAGLTGAAPGVGVIQMPVADGGDGTVAAAIAAGFHPTQTAVLGPTGEHLTATFAVRDGTAVIELAEASGLRRLSGGLAPLTATSYGTGQLLATARDLGCRRIVLGLGGSACTDGGAGMMSALGLRLLDRSGAAPAPGGAGLRDLYRLGTNGFSWAPDLLVAADVDNPLLGPNGAAAVYGPQKGATPSDVDILEAGLRRWFQVVGGPDGPGMGAAGGVAYAASAFLSARIRPGIDLVLNLLGFREAAARAGLVITGEGTLDAQTLRGKAPAGVAAAARAAGATVIAVAGRCELPPNEVARAGFAAVYALSDLEPDPARCLANAGALLRATAARIAADWLPGKAYA